MDDDERELRWFIRRPPREWLHWRGIDHNITPDTVHEVLDGPFHAVPGCNAALKENWSGHQPTFDEKCPSCGEPIFRRRISYQAGDDTSVWVWKVRTQVLEELQRMERNGTVFDGARIVLERPGYWKAMLPPKGINVR